MAYMFLRHLKMLTLDPMLHGHTRKALKDASITLPSLTICARMACARGWQMTSTFRLPDQTIHVFVLTWMMTARSPVSDQCDAPAAHQHQPITWNSDVHTHASYLQADLKQYFGRNPRQHMRKKHLTDETCALIQRKKSMFRHLQRAKAAARTVRLQLCFSCWKKRDSKPTNLPVSTFRADFELAVSAEKYRIASLRVCHAVRADDRRFFDDLAEQTGSVASQGFHRIWDAIKPLLPRAKNKRKSNIRCPGPSVEQQATHFCHLEAGCETDYARLLAQCHAYQQQQLVEQPLELSLQQMPSRLDVENTLQRLSAHKAPGIDGISPGCLRTAGPDISESLLQLIMKMWLLGAEPIQFKGGLLCPIAKKSQSREVANMRGIMIIDVVGKLAHSLLRQRFLSTLLSWKMPLQLGGFPGCSTLFATHYLRSFHAKARDCQLPSAVLFLDVKSAFHSMIRQILFGSCHELPVHLQKLLEEIGCNLEQLRTEIERTSAQFHHDVPLADRRLLQDAHVFTWFGLSGTDATFCTSRGSRPGSPLADIAFNAVMVHVLRDLHSRLQEMPAMQCGFTALGLWAPPIAWVDDVAIPIVAPHCDTLETSVAQVAHTTHEVFLTYGLELNFKAKKTEVVLSFRSAAAPAHRQSLFVERLGQLAVPNLSMHLRCVASYEHLGTVFAADCTLQKEISHRKRRAIQAFRQVGKPILKNRHVSIGTRLKLFESLIIPVLLHGSGNWDLLPHRSFQGLHSCIMGWQRMIINDGCWTEDQHTDFALQCAWKLPPLALRLVKARLLYAFQCAANGPQLLHDFMTSVAHLPQGWFAALRQALTWLASMDSNFCPADLATASVEQVWTWLGAHCSTGPSFVRRLFKRCVLQFHVVGDIVALHKQLKEALQHGGVAFETSPTLSQIPTDTVFSCDWCEAQFDTKQKLLAHMWTAHQLSEERQFVFSDTCLACHKCFWSAARLQQHLRPSRSTPDGCFAQLTWRYAPLREACHIEVPIDLRGFLRLPAQTVPMPQLAPVDLQLLTREHAEAALQRAWTEEGFPHDLPDDVKYSVWARADAVLRSWKPDGSLNVDQLIFDLTSMALNAADEWALFLWCRLSLCYRRFLHLTPTVFQRVKKEIQEIVFESPIGKLLAWHLRITTAYQPRDDAAADTSAFQPRSLEPLLHPVQNQHASLQHILSPITHVPDPLPVPITWEDGKPIIWVLHLFSGRRRRGDCHFWSECCTGVLPGYTVRILSVDTAIDADLGNLDRGPVFARLLAIIRKRWFAAGLTGPPCETFSAARHLELEGCRHPRPLRSAMCPWLLEGRSNRELFQTLIGSRLFMHSIIAEVSLVLAGACSLMEHPAEHQDEERASVWRTQCHREWVMKLPDAWQHRIEQWHYGAVGVKPTTLRALNMGPPHIVHQVLQTNRDPLALRPCNPLRGRTDDGSFRTAAAKEYPVGLCRTLVLATLESLKYKISQFGTCTAADLSASESVWLNSLYMKACNASLSGKFLPDFQG